MDKNEHSRRKVHIIVLHEVYALCSDAESLGIERVLTVQASFTLQELRQWADASPFPTEAEFGNVLDSLQAAIDKKRAEREVGGG